MAKSSRRITLSLSRLGFCASHSKSTSEDGFFSCIFRANHNPNTSSSSSLQHLLRCYSTSISPSRFSSSKHLTFEIQSKPCFYEILSKKLPDASPSQIFVSSRRLPHSSTPFVGNSHSPGPGVCYSRFSTPAPYLLNYNFSSNSSVILSRTLGFGNRYFSLKSSDFRVPNGDFKTSVVDKPMSAIRSAFLRYREAVGLQVEAFWKRNYLVLVGIGGVALCFLLWRIMYGIASTFIGLSEGLAKYGFLALSSAVVAFTGLYFRSRFTINPDKVYRIAMRKLNTSAGILEIMGAPLSGTDLRAYVMSGGGLGLKNFKLKLRNKRCFLIFPIRGSERKGLVSVEVKKNKGQYDMKLLAVDIPMVAGPDQQFFLIGNEEEYEIGGGLISELRDPIVKAMAAEKEFEALDQQEEEEDAERELEEAERKHREEIEKIEKGGPQ